MISRRVAAHAVLAAFAANAFAGFLLHWPCRNSGYTDTVFTSACYSDLPSLFVTQPLLSRSWPFDSAHPLALSPLNAWLAWLAAQVPGGVVNQMLAAQLMLVASLLAVAVATFKLRGWRPLDAALLLLIPVWPFIAYVSTDLLSVGLAAFALYQWQQRKPLLAGALAGAALAADSWTWLLLAVFLVDAIRNESKRDGFAALGSAAAVAALLVMPRLVAGLPLLVPMDTSVGSGSLLQMFELGSTNKLDSKTVALVALAGVALSFAICQWAVRFDFDFRPETLLTVLVVIQLLTSSGIQPQKLTHVLWLVPLVWPERNFILKLSLPIIGYVIGVWMHFEAQKENSHGVSDGILLILSLGMWLSLIAIARKARMVMTVQGFDLVAISRAQVRA